MKYTNILDIPFFTSSISDMQAVLRSLLTGTEQHVLYTPNAEMLVLAAQDHNFKDVLQRSSINICDGSGPAYMARIFEKKSVPRITGVDGLMEVLRVAAETDKSVFLLGSGDADVLAQSAKFFQTTYPALTICGQHPGVSLSLAEVGDIHTLVYDEEEMEQLQHEIIMAAPDILIVAFGHPKQELFIDAFVESFPTVRLAMGVGGALDFYAGKVRRAPQWLRTIGLESLWRLVLQPWRWRRVFTALVIFPILYVRSLAQRTNTEI